MEPHQKQHLIAAQIAQLDELAEKQWYEAEVRALAMQSPDPALWLWGYDHFLSVGMLKNSQTRTCAPDLVDHEAVMTFVMDAADLLVARLGKEALVDLRRRRVGEGE